MFEGIGIGVFVILFILTFLITTECVKNLFRYPFDKVENLITGLIFGCISALLAFKIFEGILG